MDNFLHKNADIAEAGVLANKLLDPEYDNDEALDEAYKEYENYKRLYEELKKGV